MNTQKPKGEMESKIMIQDQQEKLMLRFSTLPKIMFVEQQLQPKASSKQTPPKIQSSLQATPFLILPSQAYKPWVGRLYELVESRVLMPKSMLITSGIIANFEYGNCSNTPNSCSSTLISQYYVTQTIFLATHNYRLLLIITTN